MLITASSKRCYIGERAKKKDQINKPSEGGLLSVGPICLDDVPQINRFLLVVQGKDPRDSVSHPRLILIRVDFRSADEVESRVT